MQVQVASSSPLLLHVIVLLFVLNTITRTKISSNAEETRVENKRGYLRHPGYFSGKFGHLYSAEDFFRKKKNESIPAGFASSTTGQPLYRVSPVMFQKVGVGGGSNSMHGALRGDAAGPEENYNIAKHNHDEFPHIDPSSIIHNERNTGLKGKGYQTIAKLPQSIPYFEQNNGGTYKKGKGNNRPPSRFTIPPEYTKTTQPVHYTTERVTMHPTTTENNFFLPPEFTQTTEPVFYTTEPVTIMHPTATETEIFTTHPGVKKGKGHHKPASKFTIPSEYTRTTEPVHHQTEPVTSYPETTQQIYITQPTTSGLKKGKGHHKPVTIFTIPPEYTQTTEPVYYPTEPVTMHSTTTEKELFTTHPTNSGVKKGKGHHKPASKFTIPPEYTKTTEPVHHQTEPVTSYPETTQEVFHTQQTTLGVKKEKGHHNPATMFTIPPEYTQTTEPVHYTTEQVTSYPETTQEVYHIQQTTLGVKKGKGHHNPATMFTIPPEYTQTTEPVHYTTEQVTSYPETTQEVYHIQQTTLGVKKGKGHHNPATMFTIPPEYTQTTEPVHYTTEQVTTHPETTKEVYITQPSTRPGIKKGKGHHKPGYMLTIPPEYIRTTKPVLYSTEPTTYPGPTEEIHKTQPTTSWAKKGKGHHYKPASNKFTIPSEYTMTTQSINPSRFTTVTNNVETFNPMDYDQSTLPAEFLTLKEEPHQTSTIGYPDTTYPHGNEQSDDEQFTVPGYESTKSLHSEIGNPENLVTSKPLFFTEPPIKYEVATPGSYQFTQSYDMQTDSQSTEFPHYEEVSSTYMNPSMQNTEPSHYETIKSTDFYQSTVPVEIPHESSTGSPHYEEFSTIHTDSLMKNTEISPYHADKYSDYDQATVPVEMTHQTITKNPHYEATQTASMQYTTPTFHQTDKYVDDDQVTVPVEISTQQSIKYPPYQEFPTTNSDLLMQFTDSSQYHSVMDMEDEQATMPVEVTTKYPHYEDHSTSAPSMQSTENIQYTDKHTADDDQATVPVEIPSESSTKNPHYEFSTIQPESSSQYTTAPSHYHSVEGSDDQATVPIEVAITTQMESHHTESTSSFKQSTEFDSGLQSKVPLFPSENEEQHNLNVDFNNYDNGDDVDQQSITHPYFTHPKSSTPANSPGELDWRSASTVHINPKKKYTVAPSDFFLTPIAPFKPVEFIPPQPYKEWPSHFALNNTGLEQVKVPDTIQVDLKGYPSYAENRPGIKGRGGRHNIISKPWYFMSRTIH